MEEGTFDGWLRARSLKKYAGTMSAESRIGEHLTGEYATICIFELMRLQFGHRCNLYSIARVPWDLMDDDAVIAECKWKPGPELLKRSSHISPHGFFHFHVDADFQLASQHVFNVGILDP